MNPATMTDCHAPRFARQIRSRARGVEAACAHREEELDPLAVLPIHLRLCHVRGDDSGERPLCAVHHPRPTGWGRVGGGGGAERGWHEASNATRCARLPPKSVQMSPTTQAACSATCDRRATHAEPAMHAPPPEAGYWAGTTADRRLNVRHEGEGDALRDLREADGDAQ